MVNILTEQIGTTFNPSIQNTNQSYRMLATQMGRIEDFFNPIRPGQPQNSPVQVMRMPVAKPIIQEQSVLQPKVVDQVVQAPPCVVMVHRNDDADEVVRNVQQQNLGAHNNISHLVETIMAQNGLNIGLHKNFVSPLSEYVLQTELPRGSKIPKLTKFASDTSESTVEQIVHNLDEAGDLANNDNLRLKLFSNSLTKNAFTWYTTLAPHSLISVRKVVS